MHRNRLTAGLPDLLTGFKGRAPEKGKGREGWELREGEGDGGMERGRKKGTG